MLVHYKRIRVQNLLFVVQLFQGKSPTTVMHYTSDPVGNHLRPVNYLSGSLSTLYHATGPETCEDSDRQGQRQQRFVFLIKITVKKILNFTANLQFCELS